MSSDSVSLVDLPYWESGKRKIRFLYLSSDKSFKLSKQGSEEDHLVPLFLGADLFSATDIRTENHPRYHAKFAKKGLATKLLFPSDFRIQGLRVSTSCNGLWFYCVHGVFRVAFELYSRQEQLSVLESFQDLWKLQINEEQLNPVYKLEAAFDPQMLLDQTTPRPSSTSSPNASVSHQGHPQSQEVDPGPSQSEPGLQLPDDAPSADHDYCSTTVSGQCNRVAQKLHSMADMLKEVSREEAVLKFLDHIERWIGGRLDEESLTDVMTTLLDSHPHAYSSVYSSPLLQALAAWLGRQFHSANGSVSLQVESFKRRHLERIADLPPAEELAAQLFPKAMRNLLVGWMGLGEEDEASAWKRPSEFPIVLLMLEFANHNLITGAAHVLYSSLICR